MAKYKGKRFIDKKDLNNHKNKGLNIKKFILNILALICVCAIIFSLYNIFSWYNENKKSKDILEEIQENISIATEEVKIKDTTIKKFHYDFSNILLKNPETIGWISVPNTKINYPVVQTTNNETYLDHSFDKSNNSAGWIFADYNCNLKNANVSSNNPSNTILYGHNRKDLSMFGSLKNLLEDNWFDKEENKYINFSTLDETHVYQIFSVFVCNSENVSDYIKTNFSSNENFKNYLKQLKIMTYTKFDTDITNTNKILTLYTCYGMNNQRLLVCAALIE